MQCELFGNNEIEFPINFDIKIIMFSMTGEDRNNKIIDEIMSHFEIKYSHKGKKYSSNGKYISYTVNITVKDKPQMEALYQKLKEIPEIKYAL